MPSGNMTRKTDAAPGYLFGNQALPFDPDSDPEQEKPVRAEKVQSDFASQITPPKSAKRTQNDRKNPPTYPADYASNNLYTMQAKAFAPYSCKGRFFPWVVQILVNPAPSAVRI